MNRKRTSRELRAIGFNIADEIETRAQPLIANGMTRDRAVMLTIALMSGHMQIIQG
jgi:hypothetical protein